jgi:hypothetical protein
VERWNLFFDLAMHVQSKRKCFAKGIEKEKLAAFAPNAQNALGGFHPARCLAARPKFRPLWPFG